MNPKRVKAKLTKITFNDLFHLLDVLTISVHECRYTVYRIPYIFIIIQNLSGIGHQEDLKEAGVDLVHELPSVGRNFR